MTITIRDHRTGEAIRSWNQPGTKQQVMGMAYEYVVQPTDLVLYSKGRVEVWVLP